MVLHLLRRDGEGPPYGFGLPIYDHALVIARPRACGIDLLPSMIKGGLPQPLTKQLNVTIKESKMLKGIGAD